MGADMEPLTAEDPPAIGSYRLRARLGSGGMGRVYLGSSPAGRAVAIKVIHPELAHDETFRSRFRREVAAPLALDQSPHHGIQARLLPVIHTAGGPRRMAVHGNGDDTPTRARTVRSPAADRPAERASGRGSLPDRTPMMRRGSPASVRSGADAAPLRSSTWPPPTAMCTGASPASRPMVTSGAPGSVSLRKVSAAKVNQVERKASEPSAVTMKSRPQRPSA